MIWLYAFTSGGGVVWSLDLDGLRWRRHELVGPCDLVPEKSAGLAVRSGVRGPVVGVYRVERSHCLVVGRQLFDLSLPTVVEHRHRGPWSRLVVRQGARTAGAWRFEGWFLPDLVPVFKDPYMFPDDEPVWTAFALYQIARRANGDPDITAGPQDYLLDWSPWVKD